MNPSPDPDVAWEEFSTTGVLGPSSVALLIKLTGQIAARTSFPPPPQHSKWDHDAIIDFLGGMVDGKRGIAFVTAAALKSRDQASFERQLIASVENWLKDQAKMTVVGRMRRRLVTLLSSDPRFERASSFVGTDAWTLPLWGTSVWQGDEDDLFDSTFRHQDEGLTELNSAGPTSTRNASILIKYAHHVLTTALGALRDQLIARFVVRRYQLENPTAVELHEDLLGSSASTNVVEDEVLVHDARDAILAALTAHEEVVLALHESPSELAKRFSLTVADAEGEIASLMVRLQPLALRNEIGLEALRMVIDECSKRL